MKLNNFHYNPNNIVSWNLYEELNEEDEKEPVLDVYFNTPVPFATHFVYNPGAKPTPAENPPFKTFFVVTVYRDEALHIHLELTRFFSLKSK